MKRPLIGPIAKNDALWELELDIARVGRILAIDHPSTPQYAEALLEDRRLRDQRFERWHGAAVFSAPIGRDTTA
jgi:hypothetical protein